MKITCDRIKNDKADPRKYLNIYWETFHINKSNIKLLIKFVLIIIIRTNKTSDCETTNIISDYNLAIIRIHFYISIRIYICILIHI